MDPPRRHLRLLPDAGLPGLAEGRQADAEKRPRGAHPPNCDCEYAVRFNASTTVAGYDPEQYLAAYKGAEGVHIRRSSTPSAGPITPRTGRRSPRQKRAAYATRKLSTIEDEDAKIKAIKDTMTKQVQALPESARESLGPIPVYGSPCEFCDSAWKHPATGTRGNYCCWTKLWLPFVSQSVMLSRNTALSFLDLGLPPKPTEQELQTIVAHKGIFPIFTSTSFGDLQLPGRDTVLQMHVPEGYKGCQFIQPVALLKFRQQDEVLFSRGMQYRVLNASIKDDRYFLKSRCFQMSKICTRKISAWDSVLHFIVSTCIPECNVCIY